MSKTVKKPHYHGHRNRLRERFLLGGTESVADYELLELLLFTAYPRGDVKPLAKEILHEFKSFATAISASEYNLRKVKGLGTAGIAALKTVHAASKLFLKDKSMLGPIQMTLGNIIEYCKVAMGKLQIEQLRILFLNKKHYLMHDAVLQEGTVDHTAIYTREIIKKTLEIGASSIVIVHNHPTGDPTPSQADILATRDIQNAAEKLNIEVMDHIIIGHNSHLSFHHRGLL